MSKGEDSRGALQRIANQLVATICDAQFAKCTKMLLHRRRQKDLVETRAKERRTMLSANGAASARKEIPLMMSNRAKKTAHAAGAIILQAKEVWVWAMGIRNAATPTATTV